MENGLNQRDLDNITTAVKKFPDIEQAIIFGSRAKGNHKKGSDVDLAIKGKNISEETVKRLSGELNEEMPLPYFFDVVHFDKISNSGLADHISRVGEVIFERDKK